MADRSSQKTGPRACTTCAKAKARCIPCSNPLKCERCDRLQKPCSQQTPAPPRRRKEQRPTRVSQLEKRIDDLTSQLRSPDAEPLDSSNGEQRCNQMFAYGGRAFPTYRNSETNRDTAERNEWPEAPPMLDGAGPGGSRAASIWPQDDEAVQLLAEFRENMMPLFPFVIIPPDMSAKTLRLERPFTWKATMLEACSLDGDRQLRLGRDLLKDLSEALLVKPHKSLDVLQGLLLFIGWFHFGLNSFQVTNLLGLARSLCLSLGFDERQLQGRQLETTSENLEQMRAFAGTYYLTTAVFTTSKRRDALMNIPYLEGICQVVEMKAEYSTDELLVRMVRIQKIAQSISLTFSSSHRSLENPQLSFLPMMMAVKGFQTQLEDYKASLPPYLRDNYGLMGHVHIAEVLLYEVALQDSPQDNEMLQVADRIELLWALLRATKSFLAIRYANLVTETPRFLCISSYDFMFAFITSLKLVTLQSPGWDLAFVRRHLALGDLLNLQIRDLETLCERRKMRRHEHETFRTEEDPFKKMASMLKGLKAFVQAIPQPLAVTIDFAQEPTPISSNGSAHDADTPMEPSTASWQDIWNDDLLNVDTWDHSRELFEFSPGGLLG
ncbi:hypothetical protein BX600DRAFT_547409 [Xylariales sp. PMI_506]|nr:hypothetical protein BX600DRAFT_547409 [Xylariales sp. PMI_506]